MIQPTPMKITTNAVISLLDSPQALIRYYGYLLNFFIMQCLYYGLRKGYSMLHSNLYHGNNHNCGIPIDGLVTSNPYTQNGINHAYFKVFVPVVYLDIFLF